MGCWVPQESILEGYKFLTSKLPNTSAEVIQKFLRRMNKIWLRREKRRVARVKEKYASTIADLKRQLAMAKPYHGVMAERKIRCLSGQVRSIQEKKLKGRPKLWNEYEEEDNYFDLDGDDQSRQDDDGYGESKSRGRGDGGSTRRRSASAGARRSDHPEQREWNKHYIREDSLSLSRNTVRASSPCSREYCPSRQHTSHKNDDSFNNHHPTTASKTLKQLNSVSTNELLDASLNSLEQINRRVKINGICAHDGTGDGGAYSHLEHPSAEYLEGALWLGRNMLMNSEELVGEIDSYRSTYMREVAQLSKEVGKSNASNSHEMASFTDRFALLAVSGITEAMSIVYHNRQKSRNLLQDAAAIAPGDKEAMRKLLLELPIESMLSQSNNDISKDGQVKGILGS